LNYPIYKEKHIKLTNVNKELTEFPQKANEIVNFKCINCNKNYKSRVGLWKHKQKCAQQCSKIENNEENKYSFLAESEFSAEGIDFSDPGALLKR
jgi:hypothetical protein